jgi:hypothetical protein
MIHTKIIETTILGKKINKIVTSVQNYDLAEDKCTIRYELRYRDPKRESPAIPDSIQISDTWELPETVVNSWSGSNTYLADKLCEQFGFTPIAHANSDMALEY